MSFVPRTSVSIAAVLILSSSPPSPTIPYAVDVSCADLVSVSWSGFRVDVAEGRPASDTNPAHCFVQGTIDTEVHFELLLPLPGAWNGRFVMGGGGGFVGSVQNQALAFLAPSALADGFATIGTDTGHEGSGIDASWALGREDREINFGHRAVHLTAETGKTIIRLHYGRDIDYSYFLGCSRGGGQGMMASQRFPDDFDGIVAGAPAYDWTGIGALGIQIQQAMYPNPSDLSAPVVTAEARQLLASAILNECDHLDGLTDGILNDPRDCGFGPEDLPRCIDDDTTRCVTNQQVRAIQSVYGGATVRGEQIFPGFPFGGEVDAGGWDTWTTGARDALGPGTPNYLFAFGTQIYKYLVFDDPEWDYASYDFSTWVTDTRRAARILNATEADLTPFKVAGGRIILWNGWSDPAITTLGTIQYYEAVEQQHPDAASFVRLFLMPGVLHCSGGPGPDQVEWLTAIQRWVEDGEAPNRLIATKRGANDEIEMQRPLCAYPAKAVYDGAGDAKKEESFECPVPSGGQ